MARPVYILGAGFSKTISDEMPITFELTKLIKQRNPDIAINLGNMTFEQWLTVHSTDLPFLENYENTQRRSTSEKITESVGDIIAERTDRASSVPCPEWLTELINIWHEEKAVVITLNYDTLVERAVNSANLIDYDGKSTINSENIVHPSPMSGPALVWDDQGEYVDNESFQLIKLHGSINWFYSRFDAGVVSAQKLRVREKFNSKRTIKHSEKIISEMIESQDRLIIPPVVSKDKFYGTNISNILWRTARKYLQQAESVTFIGYSLPPEDFVTSQLLKELSSDIKIIVADRFADKKFNTGITKNLSDIILARPSNIFTSDRYMEELIDFIRTERK